MGAVKFTAQLEEPLPPISVPLRPADRDVVLQLQPVLNECFVSGKYVDLRYDRNLDPPLSDIERGVVRKFTNQ